MADRPIRPEVVRAMGTLAAAYRFDTVKLMREFDLNWPDASAAEVDAAMRAGRDYMSGGEDE